MSSFATNDQCLGAVTLDLVNGQTNISTAGTPTVIINQRQRALTALASTSAKVKDDVTGLNAPELAIGESFAMLLTAGFTGTNGALEYKQLHSVKGNVGARGCWFAGSCSGRSCAGCLRSVPVG